VRTAVVLGTNFLVGAAVLAWVLVRHGAPALEVLASGPRLGLLVLFPLAVAASFTAYAWRWKVLLAGLGARPRLAALVGYRAAGQSLSSLIPSGKLGGEPLRTLLLARGGVGAAQAIAAVAVDRTLEMGGAAAFACAYALVLLRRGVPALEGALVTVSLGAAALTLGVALTVRRLRRGAGLVTALARSSGLTRLAFVRQQMDVLGAAEEEAARLIAQPQRMARAFALGLAANLLVLGEYALLLAAFASRAGRSRWWRPCSRPAPRTRFPSRPPSARSRARSCGSSGCSAIRRRSAWPSASWCGSARWRGSCPGSSTS